MNPRTVVPTWVAFGVIVRWIVPLWPGASTSGLYVLVPKVTSDQMSPLSADTEASKGFSCTSTLVVTGVGGAPPEPKGPMSVGYINHSPHGTSGTVSDAVTVFGPTGPAVTSGAPVK